MVRLFTIWPCLLLLALVMVGGGVSCSKQQPVSKTAISIVGFMGGSTFTGGIMVWGKSTSGKSFALSMSNESDTTSLTLAAESWRFIAVGWLGATPLEGAVKCGITEKTLSEAQTSVGITLSDAGCTQPDFASSDYVAANSFLPLEFITCGNVTGKAAGENCDGASKGGAKSYEIAFFDSIDGVPVGEAGLSSSCINESDSSSVTSTSYLIPVGARGLANMGIGVKAFPLPDCEGSVIKFIFEEGLINGTANALVYSAGGATELFLQTAPLAPNISAYTVASASYDQNVAIAANSPTNDGGAVSSWSISPALPSGLSLNTETGEITGTPTTSAA